MQSLSKPLTLLLLVLLLAQVGVFYGFSRSEYVPEIRPLVGFASELGAWQRTQDGVTEQAVLDELRADDLLIRTYYNQGSGRSAHLMVAAFRTQRTGVVPHSPKHCLPANGFEPREAAIVELDVPGAPPVHANRYIVARGDERSLVYYWYHTAHRTVASEYMAKMYLVVDSLRYNRSDTSLVRVVVPIQGATQTAEAAAQEFIRSLVAPLAAYLPG